MAPATAEPDPVGAAPSDRGSSISEPAPAKINLDLLVTGRRADGYHELDSLVVFADVGDRVSAAPAAAPHLTIDGPFGADVPQGGTNIVVRAAGTLAARLGRSPDVALHLVKRLPVASGIGGGSSDAAAALRALDRLWAPGLDAVELRDIGLALGADVPVCLYARPARLRGIGERLDPVRGLPSIPLVLVNPGAPVSTAAVFAHLDTSEYDTGRPDPLPPQPSLAQLVVWLGQSHNALQEPACALEPKVAEALAVLAAAPECWLARMSGSGATCFGIFKDEAASAAAAAAITRSRPDWWVVATRAGGAAA